jgi:hypothetical protein
MYIGSKKQKTSLQKWEKQKTLKKSKPYPEAGR